MTDEKPLAPSDSTATAQERAVADPAGADVPTGVSLASLAAAAGAEFRADAALSDLTTLRLGGRLRGLIDCPTAESVSAVFAAMASTQRAVLVLGGGSNLVAADASTGHDELDLVAVRSSDRSITLADDPKRGSGGARGETGSGVPRDAASDATGDAVTPAETVILRAGAGAVWDDVVAESVARGLGGLECLSGIPGSAGATPVQNVGAYGVEVADVLHSVELVDRATGTVSTVGPEDLHTLGLAYRTSILKNTDRAMVTAVSFRLSTDGLSAPLRFGELARRLGAVGAGVQRRPVAEVRDAVLALRRGKGMVHDAADPDTWSAGSFFTNPVVPAPVSETIRRRAVERGIAEERVPAFPAGNNADGEPLIKLSAAWLIDFSGLSKGYPGPEAPARLSTKHTLALTNRGQATTADLVALARDVRATVLAETGVLLEPEPVWLSVEIGEV